MTRVIRALVAAALLVGCASSSKTYGPDGKEAYSINCSGLARTWGMCFEKAGDLCGPRGYEVLERASDKGVVATVNPGGGFGGSTISRSLLIKCKD